MGSPFDILLSGGAGGLSFAPQSGASATQTGDLSGARINFGSSAPGFTPLQIVSIAGGAIALLWVLKKVK